MIVFRGCFRNRGCFRIAAVLRTTVPVPKWAEPCGRVRGLLLDAGESDGNKLPGACFFKFFLFCVFAAMCISFVRSHGVFCFVAFCFVLFYVWVDAACIRTSFRQARCVDDDALVVLIPAPALVADVDDYDVDVGGNR